MSNKNYQEDVVVRSLSKKSDLQINPYKKQIFELYGHRAKGDVGIGSRGKMHFLKKLGYIHVWVDQFEKW